MQDCFSIGNHITQLLQPDHFLLYSDLMWSAKRKIGKSGPFIISWTFLHASTGSGLKLFPKSHNPNYRYWRIQGTFQFRRKDKLCLVAQIPYHLVNDFYISWYILLFARAGAFQAFSRCDYFFHGHSCHKLEKVLFNYSWKYLPTFFDIFSNSSKGW